LQPHQIRYAYLEMENCPGHDMTQTRYEIVSTIGVGATSRVDKAHDTLIDRTVAMKTFGHGFGSEELQKQFIREAQILGRLSHPNIVSIYDLGTNEDGSAYLVMEFVPGKTLESVMAAPGGLPLARVGVWAGDLANALNRAHRAGIVHGDVKPANIFVTDEGHIKLGDFGIARYATQLSGTGKLVGTPAYLSPEQIKGETQDHRSDIFSLGIILYQMAAGVRPFDGSSVTAVCAQIVAAEPPPPSRYNPQLPKEFDRVVMRCLAKDPNARYASGESLAASLYPFARSKAEAAPNRFDFSWWRRPLHLRDAWIAFAACAAALLVIAGGHNWNAHRSHGKTVLAATSLSTEQVSHSTGLQLEAGLPISGGPMAITNIPNLNGSEADAPSHSRSAHVQSQPAKHPRQLTAGHGNGTHANGRSISGNPTETVTGSSSPPREASHPDAAIPPVHTLTIAQLPLNIEIASAIDGETLAIYADQHLVATSPLSVTSSGEMLHLERPLAAGPHEFRVALYRSDQSLHLERGGLAEIQSGTANLLSIKVVKHAKMLVKRDAALEISWPGAAPPRSSKQGETIADAASPSH
jgi:serine/threonine protein kinase